MSIYTYKITHKISEALGIEPHEVPSLSDQELNIIPEDAKWGVGSMPLLYGNKHAERNIPWNRGKDCKGLIAGNQLAHMNGKQTRFKKCMIPHNKGVSLSDSVKKQISEKVSQHCWINDGKNNIKQLKSDPIPEGWVRGRIMDWKRNSKRVVC